MKTQRKTTGRPKVYAPKKKHRIVCVGCGETVETPRRNQDYCKQRECQKKRKAANMKDFIGRLFKKMEGK